MDEPMIMNYASVNQFNNLFYKTFIDCFMLINNLNTKKLTLIELLYIKKQVSNAFNIVLAKLPTKKIIDVEKEQSNYFFINALICGSLIELLNKENNFDIDEIIFSLLAKIKSILVD